MTGPQLTREKATLLAAQMYTYDQNETWPASFCSFPVHADRLIAIKRQTIF